MNVMIPSKRLRKYVNLTCDAIPNRACDDVSGADLPLSIQAYFCDTRSPLRGLPLHAPLPLKRFLECPLTAPLPLTPFSARSIRSALTSWAGR